MRESGRTDRGSARRHDPGCDERRPGPQGISPICGTIFGTPSFEDSRYVVVVTTSSTGSNENHAFYIAVF
jgi:hypothetical protein